MYRGVYSVIYTYIIGKRIGNFVMMKLHHFFSDTVFSLRCFLAFLDFGNVGDLFVNFGDLFIRFFFLLGILLFFEGFVNFFDPFSVDVKDQEVANQFIIHFADFKLIGREAVDDQFQDLERLLD